MYILIMESTHNFLFFRVSVVLLYVYTGKRLTLPYICSSSTPTMPSFLINTININLYLNRAQQQAPKSLLRLYYRLFLAKTFTRFLISRCVSYCECFTNHLRRATMVYNCHLAKGLQSLRLCIFKFQIAKSVVKRNREIIKGLYFSPYL